MTRHALSYAFALVACAVIAVGCSSNSDSDPTPTVTVEAASPTPATSTDLREVNLEATAPVQDLISQSGGTYVADNVIYADLTGDGVDEAVVPLSSGGTLGDIAYVVLTPVGDAVEPLLTSEPGGEGGVNVAVEGDTLVETQAVYGPADPNCCPSQLRVRTYAWDGATLALVSDETSPSGAGAKTPSQ